METGDDSAKMMRVAEAAKVLGVSPDTVRNLFHRDVDLPDDERRFKRSFRLGFGYGEIRLHPQDIEDLKVYPSAEGSEA